MKIETESDLELSHNFAQLHSIEINSSITRTGKLGIKKIPSLGRSGKKNNKCLKKVLRKGKQQLICHEFYKKLKRVVVSKDEPPALLVNELQKKSSNKLGMFIDLLQSVQGFNISANWMVSWSLLNSLQTVVIVFIASIMLVFTQLKANQLFRSIVYGSCILHLVDMFLKSTMQHIENGQKLSTLKQITYYYFYQTFSIDLFYLFSLAFILFNLHTSIDIMCCIVIFVKMFTSVSRFDHFQYLYLTISSIQRYYHVIKVLLLNFMIAHIIAVLLLLMSQMAGNADESWIIKHNLADADWAEKYVWSYYWGVTIMLTVGFGDFAASNKNQALVLIFIQTFSCILLAYNINTVGVILNQIRIKQRERTKKVKIFMKMSEQDQIPYNLSNQIISYIDQSFQIKDKFQYQQYQQVIESLPVAKKQQLKKQAYRKIFSQIPFTNVLSRNGLSILMQKIHRKVAHPQQIILKKDQHFNLTVLCKGKVGFCCNNKSKLNGVNFQTIKSEGALKDNAKLLSLKFFKKNTSVYDIKSLDYSVFFQLTLQQIIQSLRNIPLDYELLCQMRDKDQIYLNDYQVYPCQHCSKSDKHDIFNCPKVHYIPLKRYVIMKNLKLEKKQKFDKCRQKCKRSRKNMKTLKQIFTITEDFSQSSNGQRQQGSLGNLRNLRQLAIKRKQKNKKVVYHKKVSLDLHECNSIQPDFGVDFTKSVSLNLQLTNWLGIQSDVAANFQYYMKNHNPDLLFRRNLDRMDQSKVVEN